MKIGYFAWEVGLKLSATTNTRPERFFFGSNLRFGGRQ